MKNSKVFHQFYDYSVENGVLSLNTYNGNFIYTYPFFSIGQNTYTLSTCLVYNPSYKITDFSGIKIGFGNGFKLDIEEYVFPYQTYYNLEGFSTNNYVYIDSVWNIHKFVYYKEETKNQDVFNVYYDESGTGLKLMVFSTFYVLIDELDNKYYFSNNRLVEKRSGLSNSIVRKIEYSNNDVVSIYDNRKQTRRIVLSYSNHLLTSVTNTLTSESFSLSYDSNLLLHINHHYDTISRLEQTFKYNDNGLIEYIINNVSLEALKIEYNNYSELHRISSGTIKQIIRTSETDNMIYCGDGIYAGENDYVSNKGIDYFNTIYQMTEELVRIKDIYNYYSSYTEKIDKNGITVRYSFDTEGRTLSSLKYKNSNFFTLEREKGILLSEEGNALVKLNNKNMIVLNSSNNSYIIEDSDSISPFNQFKDTLNDEKDLFILSLYIMFPNNNYHSRVLNLKCSFINSNDDFVKKVILNKVDSGSFQKVEFFIDIKDKWEDLQSFEIYFDNPYDTAYISDILINEGNVPILLIDNISPVDHHENGVITREIVYGSIIQIDEESKVINEDFYLTDDDITSTYLSLKKNSNLYDFYYNNKTKVRLL